jgi:hypothetical protein
MGAGWVWGWRTLDFEDDDEDDFEERSGPLDIGHARSALGVT